MTAGAELPHDYDWIVGHHGNETHLAPDVDEKEHLVNDCWCEPEEYYKDDSSKVVMHRPYVKRGKIPEGL